MDKSVILILLSFFLAAPLCATDLSRDDFSAYAPLSFGPLKLASVHHSPIIKDWVINFDVSPDGRYAAVLHDSMTIAALNGGQTISEDTGLGTTDRTAMGAPLLLKWSDDSKFVWTAKRRVQKPSGFAISGLTPIQMLTNGHMNNLAAPKHGEDLLDSIYWVNSKGLALVAYGINGGYYRPERKNTNPTLSVVDVQKGSVLSSVSILQLLKDAQATVRNSDSLRLSNVTATVLPDGRVKSLVDILNVDGEIVWTEGKKPRLLTLPLGNGKDRQICMTPDGKSVLVVNVLRTKGAIIRETFSAQNEGGYSPGRPVTGMLAALYDIDTGKQLWSINATIKSDPSGAPPPPVISSDGRYALIRTVAGIDPASIALVSISDGKIIQRLPVSSGQDSNTNAMGFLSHGVWTHEGNVTALYSF